MGSVPTEEVPMESFREIFNRLIRLLPFVAGPFCYHRFHPELFHPYPGVWNNPDQPSSAFAAGSGASSARPDPSPRAGAGHAGAPRHPAGDRARPYLTWIEMNSWGHHGEPFW
jgi:hypothetical protein